MTSPAMLDYLRSGVGVRDLAERVCRRPGGLDFSPPNRRFEMTIDLTKCLECIEKSFAVE